MVTRYERNTTFKVSVTYQSGSTNVNPSSNIANLKVYKPDGTIYITGVSGMNDTTGVYHYYVSTQTSDPLGIWVCEWTANFDYSAPWSYSPKVDREAFELVYVK